MVTGKINGNRCETLLNHACQYDERKIILISLPYIQLKKDRSNKKLWETNYLVYAFKYFQNLSDDMKRKCRPYFVRQSH